MRWGRERLLQLVLEIGLEREGNLQGIFCNLIGMEQLFELGFNLEIDRKQW